MFTDIVDKGDDRCVMVAMENEYIYDDLPNKVKVKELNDWTPLGIVRVIESTAFKVVDHVRESDTKETIVKRILPESKWEFTEELYRKNRIVA